MIVQLISKVDYKISLNDVFMAMKICSKTFIESTDPGVKLAVRAAYTQMLNSFCLNQYLTLVIKILIDLNNNAFSK